MLRALAANKKKFLTVIKKVLQHVLLLSLFLISNMLLLSCGAALYFANQTAARDQTKKINIYYADAEDNRLDIYLPNNLNNSTSSSPAASASLTRPVIIFFYGGCWGACLTYKKDSYAFLAQAFTSIGYIVAIPNYRHYPDVLFTDIMQDAAKATEWIQVNISAFGGDKSQIVLLGHSAGAHIAAMLALDESWLDNRTRSNVKGFIGLAGPYDFLPFTETYQAKLFASEHSYANSQPINFVDGSEAPMLLLHGNDDTRVKPSNLESLSNVARNKGGDVQSHRYDDINHTEIVASLSKFYRDRRPVMNDIENFLQEITTIK